MSNHEHYLVVGLGVTGLSVVKHLVKLGMEVSVTDSRAEPPNSVELAAAFPQVPLAVGKIVIPDNITTIVLSPGVALNDPALKSATDQGLEIIGDIELFARVVDKPVIAITGTNGKSTVTTLLGMMAKASGINAGVGGNLGTPALELLDPQLQCYILELSSFQLETTSSLKPLVAAILNVGPDHMDRYADIAAYTAAKQRIFHNAKHVVINRADALTNVPENLNIPTVSFGLDVPTEDNYGVSDAANYACLFKGTLPLMPACELLILGQHNVANALATLAIGELAGFDRKAMLNTLREFKGLEHACERVATIQDVLWVNDSKGTNVAATVAALRGLAENITGKWVIILGGVGKGADFASLVQPVLKYCKAAVLIGEEQKQLWDLLSPVIKCYKAGDFPTAINLAAAHANAGDGVLLSPACASMDMFVNYAHRGKMFKQLVLERIDNQHATIAD